MTFELRPNIVFWHSKSYFDIQTEAEYRILTFETLFRHLNWGRMSYFYIRNPNLTFEPRPNIIFWHSKAYFDIQTEAEIPILTFKILFWRSNWSRIKYFDIRNDIMTFELKPNVEFWQSKFYFTIELRPNIVFRHSKSYSDIRNPILTFELKPNKVFWHTKWYYDIRTEAECRILTIEILFHHRIKAEYRI